MANLTSLYCNKHTTVLVNVHVRPVPWPQPARPSRGRDGRDFRVFCGVFQGVAYPFTVTPSCVIKPKTNIQKKNRLDREVLAKANVWRAFTVLLDSTLLLIGLGQNEKRGRWGGGRQGGKDSSGACLRAVLWSTTNYIDQVKKQTKKNCNFYTPGNANFQFTLALWHNTGLLPSQQH